MSEKDIHKQPDHLKKNKSCEASGINGHKIYANHAYKDSNNQVITATYEKIIDFGYNKDKIITINGSALSAQDIYSAGPNINISNQIISGKNWTPEIISATSGKADKTYVDSTISSVSINLNDKIDSVSSSIKFEVDYNKFILEQEIENNKNTINNTISSVSSTLNNNITNTKTELQNNIDKKFDSSSISSYYTKNEITDILSQSGTYLSSNALDNLSGKWETVENKFDTSSMTAYYTSAEVEARLATVGNFEIVEGDETGYPLVDEPKARTIYLVKIEGKYPDSYKEWICTNVETKTFELIGDTTLSFDDYYKKTETSSKSELETKFNTKEDNLSFGYEEDKIISINGSALSAGSEYTAGQYIKIDNKEISVSGTKPLTYDENTIYKEETDDYIKIGLIDAPKDNNQYVRKNGSWDVVNLPYYGNGLNFDKLGILTVTGKQNSLTTEQLSAISSVSSKQDILSSEQLSAISSVSGKQDILTDYTPAVWNSKQDALTNEQLSSISSISSISSGLDDAFVEIENIYSAVNFINSEVDELIDKTEIIDNDLSSLSSNFNDISFNLENNYYKKTETSSLDELNTEFNKKQNNLTTEQLCSISSVSSISSNLENNYYTKNEVDEIISNFGGFEVHASLEEITQPKTNVIYLIGPKGTGTDKYEEYIYTTEFVLIGETTVDLTNYYKKTETSSTSELTNKFAEKQDNLTSEQLSAISSVSGLENTVNNMGVTVEYSNEIVTLSFGA